MIQQTSLFAYHKLEKSGKLGEQELLIKHCIISMGRPMTINEINNIYFRGEQINIVSGRIRGLTKKGHLYWTGTYKINPRTQNKNRLWWVTDQPLPQEYIDKNIGGK